MRLPVCSIILCMVLYAKAYSQTNGNYNYSIAGRGFSIMQVPKILNQDGQHYLNTYVNGGMIKFNDNQISYRFSGGYFRQDLEVSKDCINCDIFDGKVTDYAFKIGFEKNFNYARIQPYIAFDLGYRYNGYEGTMHTLNNLRSTTAINVLEDIKSGLTAAPVLGLKLNVFPQLTLFAESSFELYYAYVRQQTVSQDNQAIKFKNTFNRGEFLINPLSLGLQVHLGNKN
jgi:hypothetical protein